MNRTTTVLVALITAAGLSTMAYTVPEQRALAWGGFGGCGFGFGGCEGFFAGGCGFGCGGFFGFHKHIIQTIRQTNTCHGNGDEQKAYSNDDQDQRDKQTVCINTAVNHVGPGLVSGPSIPIFNPPHNQVKPPAPDNDNLKPGAIGGNGGSGGAAGSGGEGGQGGKNVGDITSTSKTNVNQKANGGNSNGGHAGNANGGNAKT